MPLRRADIIVIDLKASQQQKQIRGCILALGAFIFLAFALIPPYLRFTEKKKMEDRLAAPVQHGIARVKAIATRSEGDVTNYFSGQVLVDFRGKNVMAQNILKLDKLKEGQDVDIAYRVGKSGKVYIELVSPLNSAP